MAHRRMLTDDQISQLFDPPIDQRALIRHYTLSPADLALICRGRGRPRLARLDLEEPL